jgi:hypothetical protein
MKKSNIIIGSIALALLSVVIVCLTAFRERPEWKAQREEQRNPATEQKAIARMQAFAAQCKNVEEVVIQSTQNIRGETFISDSTQFTMQTNGEITIDTVLSNDGKKLSFTIAPQAGAQVIYYNLQLALPVVKNIMANNINLGIVSYHLPSLALTLKGETGCSLNTPKGIPNLAIDISELSALRYAPSQVANGSIIKASGNALLHIPEALAKQLQQKGQLILQENAIIQ